MMFSALVAAGAEPESTISPTERYAHAANAGWIDFRPDALSGVSFGDYFLSGKAYAANFGWIDFGDGTPANGIRYQNNSATDFGVNHDGSGRLSGYAYSGNIGWISFSWPTDSSDPDRPRVDLLTGSFSGFAYAANVGWLNLTGTLSTTRMAAIDTDSDGIADAWEMASFGDLTHANATSDQDHDGASDLDEYLANTDATDPASRFRIVFYQEGALRNQASLRFTVQPGRLYRVWDSADLFTWEIRSHHGLFASAGEHDTVESHPFSAKRFFRVDVRKPLQP